MTPLAFFVIGIALIGGGVVSTIVHELGHALAAWVCRVPVRVFSIGFSRRPVLRWRYGETEIALRPWFNGGFVEPYPALRPRPFATLAVTLGGVAANLVACLLLALSMLAPRPQAPTDWFQHRALPSTTAEWALRPPPGPAPWQDALRHALPILVLLQLLDIAVNLWPRTARLPDGQQLRSDGLQALDVLRGKASAQARTIGEYYRSLLAELGAGSDSGVLRGRAAPILCHWATFPVPDRAARDSKRAALCRLLRWPDLTPGECLLANAMLATDVTLHADHDLLQEARRWSADAVRLSDWPSIRAIRAAVLAETGDPAGAVALLDPIKNDDDHPLYRFYRGMYRARALHRLGRVEDARGWFAWARPTDPAVQTIGRDLEAGTAALLGLSPEDLAQPNAGPAPGGAA
ncbi:MAG TPA: site-2 protease family protein [Roseomonas sp.]|jgi:hypothetical protein